MDRKKIIKMLLRFIVLILVCTILSRAAASVTAAQVTTAFPANMAITHQVTGIGKVEQKQVSSVYTEPGQKVDQIFVRAGQKVKAGDVLFQVNMAALEEQITTLNQEVEKIDLEQRDASSRKAQVHKEQALKKQQAEDEYAQIAAETDQAVAWAKEDLERAVETLEQEQIDVAQRAYDEAVSSRSERLAAASRAIETAAQEAASDSTEDQKQIEKEQQEAELAKLLALREAKGSVAAPNDGTIIKLNIETGQVTSDQGAVLLSDDSKGGIFTVSFDQEQEAYLETGMPVILESTDGKEVETSLSISAVEEDTENSDLIRVTVEIPAQTMEIGSSAKMTVQRDSKQYETCIPVQALYESTQGTYIYILKEKESVLGTELTTVKMDVTILDKNETYAAIDESALLGQQIVVSSDRNIDEGSRVRMKVR